jgi:hypothetical protein
VMAVPSDPSMVLTSVSTMFAPSSRKSCAIRRHLVSSKVLTTTLTGINASRMRCLLLSKGCADELILAASFEVPPID